MPPQFVLWLPNLVNRGPDDWCVVGERHLYPTAEVLAEARRATAGVWATALGDFELCAGSERPEPVPAVEAALWWREAGEDLLPRPDPWIAPGFGITGMRSFLEARSPVTARFEHDTALGHLVVEATSTLYVDWGDTGWIDGPYRGPGAPRPDGTIHHSWTDMGAYDVRVEQRWSATWRLGEQSGTLAGLVTEGRIDDFPVDQIQAVRNR